jgi:hypothetical protein
VCECVGQTNSSALNFEIGANIGNNMKRVAFKDIVKLGSDCNTYGLHVHLMAVKHECVPLLDC